MAHVKGLTAGRSDIPDAGAYPAWPRAWCWII